ncbi:hypothetical protein KY285_035421 [Solanum tuberosum]|nr:hypothetical protein KY285_035421 [Solanum tuberosum]
MDDANNKPMVYEFYENPSLDVLATSSEAYRTSLPANTNKARRSEGLAQWLEDSSYPNTTLSWNVIHDSMKNPIKRSGLYFHMLKVKFIEFVSGLMSSSHMRMDQVVEVGGRLTEDSDWCGGGEGEGEVLGEI